VLGGELRRGLDPVGVSLGLEARIRPWGVGSIPTAATFGEQKMKIRWFQTKFQGSLRGLFQQEAVAETDVIEVQIPAQEGQQALKVHVNTDAVIIETAEGKRLGMLEYSDLIGEAIAEE